MPRYQNLNPEHRRPNAFEVFRWAVLDRLTRRRITAAAGAPAESIPASLDQLCSRDREARITWIGHASFLASLAGVNLLIDPVFATKVGLMYRRYGDPGLLPRELPRIDGLLITHSHYDHLDAGSVDVLARDVPVFCPVGLGRWFTRRGFRQVSELAWWDTVPLGHLRITFVPSRHWTQRSPFDFNRSHWGGYVLQSDSLSIYHAGDSAQFDGFEEIGKRFSRIQAALMPIGAYAPAWFMERNHMTPEQTGNAFLQLGAESLIPMHWGTFQLTDEPLREPRDRLVHWWNETPAAQSKKLLLPAIGETLVIEE